MGSSATVNQWMQSCLTKTWWDSTKEDMKNFDPVIYVGGLQPFFTVTKGVEKILVTMF